MEAIKLYCQWNQSDEEKKEKEKESTGNEKEKKNKTNDRKRKDRKKGTCMYVCNSRESENYLREFNNR